MQVFFQVTNNRVVYVFALALLLVGSLQSCSLLKSDKIELAPLLKFEEEIDIDKEWSSKVGSGVDGRYLRLKPALTLHVIYAADSGGHIRAYDRANGKTHWKVKTGKKITGAISTINNRVFVGTNEGEVIAYDATNGNELWSVSVSSEVLSTPLATEVGVLIVQSNDGKVYGLNQKNGEQVWVYDSTSPVLSLRGSATPVYYDEHVFVGTPGGKLLVIDAKNGQLLWRQPVALSSGKSELDRIIDIDGEPVITTDSVYAVSYQGHIVSFDLENGGMRWDKSMSSSSGLTDGFGNIYTVDVDGKVWALDKYTGKTVWVQSDLEGRGLGSPVAFDNYLVVGDQGGYIHLLSQVDGRVAGRYKVGGDGLFSKPIVSDGVFYIQSNSGKLLALSIDKET